MSHFKIVGAVLILLGCGYIGYSSASGINKESASLRKLIHSLDFMSCELQYKLTPLPELCRKTASECNGSLRDLFCILAEEMESQISPDVKSCMNMALLKVDHFSALTLKCLRQLGASLGRFDLEGQMKGIESVRATCRAYLEELESGKDSRIRIYKTLGACAGAAMVILFA